MSKIIPNFREKSELLTFLLVLENIGDFLTQFNRGHVKYILLAFIWVYFQIWHALQSVQKLRSKLARKHKFGGQTSPASFCGQPTVPNWVLHLPVKPPTTCHSSRFAKAAKSTTPTCLKLKPPRPRRPPSLPPTLPTPT